MPACHAGAVLLECVVNVSEGRDEAVLDRLAAAAGPPCSTSTATPTTIAPSSPSPAPPTWWPSGPVPGRATVATLDLRHTPGPTPGSACSTSCPSSPTSPAARPRGPRRRGRPAGRVRPLARRGAGRAGLPLRASSRRPDPDPARRPPPGLRDGARAGWPPIAARQGPTPAPGATAVGARRVLVAYNVWVSSVEVARQVAPLVRGPEVRALGLAVGARAQVSCNLVDPDRYGPGPALRRGGRPGGRRPGDRSTAASWWGSSPRSSWPSCPTRAELGLSGRELGSRLERRTATVERPG